MHELIRAIENAHKKPYGGELEPFGPDGAARALGFHRTLPGYTPTPLARLDGLGAKLGLQSLWVKDESHRLGLKAFKGLGGIYAMARCLGARLGLSDDAITFGALTAPGAAARLGQATFVAATDGNHGRGVALGAKLLGHKAVILMPRGAAPARLGAIRSFGAEATETDLNYDDTVRLAAQMADEKGWVLLQDTAWPGYETIPGWIMEGYAAMVQEAFDALDETDEAPTHVFIQAGVGSLAAAVQGYLCERLGEARPKVMVMEPMRADCLYKSMEAGGQAVRVADLDTIMAGLSCGEPSSTALPTLRDYADFFIACDDRVAATGMRILASPLPGDDRVVSGESGAVGAGLIYLLGTRPEYAGLRGRMGLNKTARVLLLSTEGDTDPDIYERIVWGGAYPIDGIAASL